MKKICLLLIAITLLASCDSNDPKEILKKSREKMESIESGYYEMTKEMKYMSGEDTIKNTYKTYFKRAPEDTIFNSIFNYENFYHEPGKDKRLLGNVLYTGNEFVTYYTGDSSGRIMSNERWEGDIAGYSHNYDFYHPLTRTGSFPLPHDSTLKSNKDTFSLVGEEIINNKPTYHVRIIKSIEKDTTQPVEMIKNEWHFWIEKDTYIPLRYVSDYSFLMNKDTMTQYTSKTLTKYNFDNEEVENKISTEAIPDFIVLEDYTPYKRPELLPKDTIAPNWKLKSLKEEEMSLSDLKGNVVLIDFFYKSCMPCMKAIPALQKLHEKYKDKDFKLVGIDPYDTIEDDKIDEFLAKRGVTYTVLLEGKDVAEQYRVSGYPTVYIIDKKGKVISSHVGYGEGTEKELEKVITDNL